MEDKKLYNIGVKLDSKEQYDRLMKDHSEKAKFFGGLNFEAMFQGYPEEYPMVVYYMVDMNPLSFMYTKQLTDLINDGFVIILQLDDKES